MHFWSSTSMQMINHEVGILVSAINKPKNQRKSGGNEMQLKQDMSSRMQDQWNSSCRILCISQTHCQKLSEISHCEIRKPHCEFRKPIAKFANHFANFATALPNSQSQLALRNSHLQALSSSVINATDFQTW